MHTVTSNDGSRIAYDRYGAGPTVILVAGALGYRRFKQFEELSQLLAEHCTVINYDRRGRGDSTEVKPFALEREIEDIAALIEAEGGAASLWGLSSGGALALRAAAALDGIEKVSVYEVPLMVDPKHNRPTPDYAERLDDLVAAGNRSGAVKHFMRNAIGIPAPIVAAMRLMPMWKGLKSTAHSLPYDWEALGDHTMYGAPLDPAEWASVTMPTQVVYGSKTADVLKQGSRALAEVPPNAELHELAGVSHNVKMGVLAPVLAEFLTASTNGGYPHPGTRASRLSGPPAR
ncbi:MAG: alpha/beta fold hydrolase [Solirubrobacterales bacterium]